MPSTESTTKLILEDLLHVASTIPGVDLPRLLGDLETIRAVAWLRLQSPAPLAAAEDELLDVRAAAAQLAVSPKYLYENHEKFPFTRRLGRSLRFSRAGISAYIQQRPGGSREVQKRPIFRG